MGKLYTLFSTKRKGVICLSNIDIGETINGAIFQAPQFISCKSPR